MKSKDKQGYPMIDKKKALTIINKRKQSQTSRNKDKQV